MAAAGDGGPDLVDVAITEDVWGAPLEELASVILTPHVAGITEQSQERILQVLAADISAMLDGRPPAAAVGAAAGAP